jgi:hypothetical protein
VYPLENPLGGVERVGGGHDGTSTRVEGGEEGRGC